MVKVFQATSRGQITLPKKWRDKFKTNYFKAIITNKQIVLVPLLEMKEIEEEQLKMLEEELEQGWKEYKEGKSISLEELRKKYGL